MMKLKVAILGYGNLGKAVEEILVFEKNVKLVGIFSERKNIFSPLGTPIFQKKDILKFENQIDLLILCSASFNKMLVDAPKYLKTFNIINTFDTHRLILQQFEKLDKIAKQNGHFAIMSAGWDPGLFSMLRVMFFSIFGQKAQCFWGKGVSLGHSNAARQANGVVDALSFTIPSKNAIKNAKNGKIDAKTHHFRKVFVTKCKNASKKEIEKQILNQENYFKNQSVKIKFVSKNKLEKLKNLSHRGEIVLTQKEQNEKYEVEFQISMTSNPKLTAKIVMSYVRVFSKLVQKYGSGAFTPLHFSPVDLLNLSNSQIISEFC